MKTFNGLIGDARGLGVPVTLVEISGTSPLAELSLTYQVRDGKSDVVVMEGKIASITTGDTMMAIHRQVGTKPLPERT